MKTEGVYTYFCKRCDLLFATVARLSVQEDKESNLHCPKCREKSTITGEGFIRHQVFSDQQKKDNSNKETPASLDTSANDVSELPYILTAQHISKILGTGLKKTYEVMEREDFPLIRIGRNKKVRRDLFLVWLQNDKLEL